MNKQTRRQSSINWSIMLILSILTPFFTYSCKSQNERTEHNPKAIELNNKAGRFYQNGNYDSALIYYDKAIALDKNYYLPHSNKVNIYLSNKEFKKALFESEQVNKIKPDLAEGWTYGNAL